MQPDDGHKSVKMQSEEVKEVKGNDRRTKKTRDIHERIT